MYVHVPPPILVTMTSLVSRISLTVDVIVTEWSGLYKTYVTISSNITSTHIQEQYKPSSCSVF